MRKFIVAAIITIAAGTASAQSSHSVRGYTRSNGTYVQPHHRTDRNATRNDNWTTRPNVNPYTGTTGTRSPSYASPAYKPYSRRR